MLRVITKAFINACSIIGGNKLPALNRAKENIKEMVNNTEKSRRLEYCVCIALKITEVNTTEMIRFLLKIK